MFDTMTFTKIMGALCGSLLVFLLGAWVAESIYHGGGSHGGDHQQAYVIDTGEEEVADEPEEEIDLPTLLAAADLDKGERVFKKCSACHKVEDGANGTGPHLNGIVGRAVGAVDGFGYSGALSEAADVWSVEELFAFLENPKAYANGTSMAFRGLDKPEDRANVIAWLEGVSN
ncbi:c-type cytochrome [Algirhabdus cladophorae]|uniref:c-type cytochrome n=1 Tax=Algirhabdus cladophorae TaxID=3377108 RepID=UPI003B846384